MNSATDAEAAYNVTSMWGAPGFHGNGSLDINGPSADENGQTAAGAEYNGNDDAMLETSDYSCTKACHQGVGQRQPQHGRLRLGAPVRRLRRRRLQRLPRLPADDGGRPRGPRAAASM